MVLDDPAKARDRLFAHCGEIAAGRAAIKKAAYAEAIVARRPPQGRG